MMKPKNDFKNHSINNDDTWYDLYEDWDLIDASITKQYGIRIKREKELTWTEFCNLVNGLMPDTPLGQIVEIRSEKDPKRIKEFNSHQKKIHSDWKKKRAEAKLENIEEYDNDMKNLYKTFEQMFSSKKDKKGSKKEVKKK